MSVGLLKGEKYELFKRLITEDQWRKATFDQLEKDFRLAGYAWEPLPVDLTLDAVVTQFAQSIAHWRDEQRGLDNLIYRIDLPTSLVPSALSDEDLATLFLFRCFQKVWLRHQYRDSAAKDGSDPDEKQLKP